MKRLITILVIFSVMLTLAIFEVSYSNRFYEKQLELLRVVERRFDEDPENLDRAETKEAFDNAYAAWKKGKAFIMMLSNHNAAKFVDEKLVSLKELIRMNQQHDAYVALKTAENYIEELMRDILPLLPNLL